VSNAVQPTNKSCRWAGPWLVVDHSSVVFRTLCQALTGHLRKTNNMPQKIVKLTVKDVRFPTSLGQHGSDAMVSYYRTMPTRTLAFLRMYCTVPQKTR
jgi:hypothetical protein